MSIRKLISPFLNAQNTNNRSNQFHGQTQAEYYLVGPRIILMSIVYTLNHYFIKQVIFHTNSASGMVNKMNPIPTLSSAGKCPKLYQPMSENYLNCSSSYFIRNNPEVKNNTYCLVIRKYLAKDGLLPFKFPKLTCRNT